MEKFCPREFSFKSNWMGFLALLRNWSIIIATVFLSVHINNLLFYPVAIVVIGFFQFAIGEVLLHEASHRHLFRHQWLNENLSFLYAEPFFYTLSIHRAAHFPHHIYFQGEKDTAWQLYRDLGVPEESSSFEIDFLKFCLGRASLVHINFFIYWYSVHSPLRVILFWLPTLLFFYHVGAILILILYWVIPYFLIFPVILYWTVIVNHYHTETGTRTSINPVCNWIFHNNGYHHTHHLFPNIPWYQLPKSYQQGFGSEGAETTRNFFDSFRQLCAKSRRLGIECGISTESLRH